METKRKHTEAGMAPEDVCAGGTGNPAAAPEPPRPDSAAAPADAARAGQDKIDRMGTESTFKLLLEFSLPAVAGMLVQMLYNVIDAAYVGHAVGPDGLAATTVANPTMMTMIALAMLVGVGGNALAAIRLGEGRRDAVERIVAASFILLIAVGVAMWAFALFALEPVLRASGANDEVLPYARDFMTVILAGAPLQFISFGMNNFIRTAGHPNRALGSMLVGTAANVVFGYLFIVAAGWGMVGAGAATVCSWAVSCVFVMQFFLKKGSPMPLHGLRGALDARIAGRIFAMGVAPAVTELGFALSSGVENNLLVTYGALDPLGADGALAVMRVVTAVGMFTFMPMMGIATGAQPLIGYNYGARSFARMKRVVAQAILLGVAVVTPLWASVLLVPDMYAHLFGLPQEYLAETAWALILFLVFIPILPIQAIGSNYFNATGQALKATLLTLTRQIIFLIPLLVVCPMVLPHILPLSALESVWFAASISDITSVALVGTFLALENKRLRKLGV